MVQFMKPWTNSHQMLMKGRTRMRNPQIHSPLYLQEIAGSDTEINIKIYLSPREPSLVLPSMFRKTSKRAVLEFLLIWELGRHYCFNTGYI